MASSGPQTRSRSAAKNASASNPAAVRRRLPRLANSSNNAAGTAGVPSGSATTASSAAKKPVPAAPRTTYTSKMHFAFAGGEDFAYAAWDPAVNKLNFMDARKHNNGQYSGMIDPVKRKETDDSSASRYEFWAKLRLGQSRMVQAYRDRAKQFILNDVLAKTASGEPLLDHERSIAESLGFGAAAATGGGVAMPAAGDGHDDDDDADEGLEDLRLRLEDLRLLVGGLVLPVVLHQVLLVVVEDAVLRLCDLDKPIDGVAQVSHLSVEVAKRFLRTRLEFHQLLLNSTRGGLALLNGLLPNGLLPNGLLGASKVLF